MPKPGQHAGAMGHAQSSCVRRILSRRVDLMRCGGHGGRIEHSRCSESAFKARDMQQVGLDPLSRPIPLASAPARAVHGEAVKGLKVTRL